MSEKNPNIEKKKELRRIINARKKACPVQERVKRSASVIAKLRRLPEFQQARNVLMYWSLPDEVFTHKAVVEFSRTKNIYLPVIDGDDLLIKKFSGEASLVDGESYAIPEPDADAPEVSIDEIDLVVVPGVAFDARGGRMGRGKGFYDRMLSKAKGRGPFKVGVCLGYQMVEEVPTESHDMMMDVVLSETGSRVADTFGIRYPIIAGGMVWCSGWRLAAAVSKAGGLGLIGAGSMKPDLLSEHIRKCREALGPEGVFGVNVPLMSPYSEELMNTIIAEKVPVVFTSAGNPKLWTSRLHDAGILVAHVVSSAKFAVKCQEAGVDAVVAEGFEAGGHNGREETTTMVLIPQVRAAVSLPLIAAGGIASGQAMAAAMALGAEGVQIGTLFAVSQESSASEAFKQLCVSLGEGDTMLALKKLSPTRLIKNGFYERVREAEDRGASADELREIVGRGLAKTGIFDGDLENGELEIGQAVSLIKEIPSIDVIMERLLSEYQSATSSLPCFLPLEAPCR